MDAQAQPAAPAAPQHTTVIHGDQAVAQVIFAQPDDGRWFRLLNWLVDSGTWAVLEPSEASTLVVLARHASSDGTSLPAMEDLCSQSGLHRASVYRALKSLEKRVVIRKVRGGAYELFPGRPFAGRRQPAPAQPTAPEPPVTLSRGRDWPSHPCNSVSHPRDGLSHRCDPLLRQDKEHDDAETPREGGGGDVILQELEADLAKHGVNRRNVQSLVGTYGVEAVRDSLANALYAKRTGQLRKNVKAYLYWSLSRGMGLYREVANERIAEGGRLIKAAIDAAVHTTDEAAVLNAAFGRADAPLRSGAVEIHELRGLSPRAVIDLLLERARSVQAGAR